MGVDYTTVGLVAALKRNGLIPANQETFQDDEFIEMLNDELQSVIVPKMMSVSESFFETSLDYPIVAGQHLYAIPAAAIGRKLKAVHIVTGTGSSQQFEPLPRLDFSTAGAGARGFMVQGNNIALYPTPTSTDGSILRFWYFARPLHLTDTVLNSVQVTGVSGSTISFAVTPASMSVGVSVNVISNVPGFNTVVLPTPIISATANSITLGVSLVDPLGVPLVNEGDWVALAGYSPIPQIPVECHYLVVQSAVAKTLMALQKDGWQAAEQKYTMLAQQILFSIAPAVDDSPQKTVNIGGIDSVSRGSRGYRH